ncbi:hypothetical protein AAG598_03205 [Citromicrobium bathyomarinum]
MTQFVAANIPVAFIEPDGKSMANSMVSAAAYLSWIAYPQRGEWKRAERFVNAVRVIPYKDEKRPRPRSQAPEDLRGIDKTKIDGSIRDAIRAVRRHYSARWMALHLMGLMGGDEDYPEVKSGHAAAGLLYKKVIDDGGNSDQRAEPRHIADRIWEHALPALAMNMALPYQQFTDDGTPTWLQHHDWAEMGFPLSVMQGPRLKDLLKHPDWVGDAVGAAATWAIILREQLPKPPETLFLPRLIAVQD